MVIDNIDLEIKAHLTRKLILQMLHYSLSGHPGSSLSIVEITVLLFEHYLINSDISSSNQLILSKGHGAPAIYANLIRRGQLNDSLISQLRTGGSPLQGHPDERFLHLLNYSSGSLGLNTSTGVGMALGMKKKKYDNKVFIIVGDGELQEGQVWESFMFASHYQLDNLVYIVDNNSLQLDGKISDVMSLGDLKSKIKAFGLDCFEVKGHDFVELNTALCIESKSPKCIIANTIKGKGVPEMENVVEWHSIHDPELAKKVIKKALERFE